ncbi:MAG TPA: hypothetical protein VG963_01965, partial [Polyangiaceae bacterium]|nr:hypothetical protein [Polyangiaceae bacterium]
MSSELGELSPNTRADSPRIRQLRVDLSGTDVAPRIERARLIDVFEAAPPVPSLGGAAMLVGYSSSGAVTTAMPFSLPSTVRIEASQDGAEPGAELPLDEGSLSLFLDAHEDLARIEVLGGSGAVLATLSDTEFEPSSSIPKQSSMEPLSPVDELRRGYPHIDFLGPAESVGLKTPAGFIETVEIGAKEAQDLRFALNRMSDKAFGAIRTVAVAKFNSDTQSEGVTYGSTVILNWNGADLGTDTIKTWVHESTHAYEFLINGGLMLAVLNKVDWPADVRAAAQRTVGEQTVCVSLLVAAELRFGAAKKQS